MNNNWTNQLIDLWWRRLPLLVGQWWKTGAEILSDGMYLTVWRSVGAWAPVAAILSGFALGVHHEGACGLYTCSIWSFRLLYLFGGLGVGLGVWASLGYIVADFIAGGHWVKHYSYTRNLSWLWADFRVAGGLTIADSLLIILLVGIPFLAKRLRPRLVPRLMYSPRHQQLLEIGVESAFLLGLLYLWTQCYPILVRPMYSWLGGAPPIEAIATVQKTTWKVLTWAVLITTGKRLLETGLRETIPVRTRQAVIEAIPHAQPKFPHVSLPWVVSATLQTALITFFMAGMLNDGLSAGIFGGGMFLFLLIRRILRNRLQGWRRSMSLLPLIMRIGLGAGVSYGISYAVLDWRTIQRESFSTLVAVLFIALIIFSIVVPETLGQQETI